MLVFFRTVQWGEGIQKVVAERANENSVWIKGNRHAKVSSHNRYFETFDEAKQYLILKSQLLIESHKRSIERELSTIQKFTGMNESDVEKSDY